MAVHWGGRGPGHMSRKSSTGRTWGDFTATAPGADPYWSNVVLLAGFNGVDAATALVDESPAARALTAQSTAQLDTAQFKYGASALLLNGTSDYATAADSADFEVSDGAFTIEGFVRLSSLPSNFTLLCHRDGAGNGWRFGREGGALVFNSNTVSFGSAEGIWSPNLNQWYHLCVDRAADKTTRIYVDGVMRSKSTDTSAIAAAAEVLAIGRLGHAATYFLPGHIDELRMTKGVARYASDGGFSVPVAAFPRGGTGWAESPDNTFTRNSANSWTPRITSNSLFTGAVKMEGTSGFVAATDVCFGLDPTPLTTLTYATAYAWYFTPSAGTRLIGNPRVAVGGQLAGDTYGVRKYWDGSQWMVEWYRIRSGVTTVHDSLVLGSDVALGVLAGALNNGAFVTLSGLSA